MPGDNHATSSMTQCYQQYCNEHNMHANVWKHPNHCKNVNIACSNVSNNLTMTTVHTTVCLERMATNNSPVPSVTLCVHCYDSPLFFSSRLIISFLVITLSFHVIGLLTHLLFVISSFYPLHQTSLYHSHLLICTSLWFHHIPLAFILLCYYFRPFQVSGI